MGQAAWRALHPNVWAHETVITIAPGARLPLRSLAVRGPEGSVTWLSPTPLTAGGVAELRGFGPVRHLVAPSALHHLHLADASSAWPDATVWAPAALRPKRPDLHIDHELESSDGAFPEYLRRYTLDGAPTFAETLFVHPTSGALFATDLVFHVRSPGPGGALTPWLLRLTGTWDQLASSRAWSFAIRDRAAFSQSLAAALDDPDWSTLVPSHGLVLPDARDALRAAVARHLGA